MADEEERPELISKITSLVQQFAPSSLWQVDTLLAVLQVSGKYANEEVTSALISIIGNEEEELSSYTVCMKEEAFTCRFINSLCSCKETKPKYH